MAVIACPACNGRGLCKVCKGRVIVEGKECTACEGMGFCVKCEGFGKVVDVETSDKAKERENGNKRGS